MKKAIFGIAKNENQANRIAESLQKAGFALKDISVLLAEHHGQRNHSHDQHEHTSNKTQQKHTNTQTAHTHSGTTHLNGTLSSLTNTGTINLPGSETLLAAGPLRSHLTASSTGRKQETISSALENQGVSQREAHHYEQSLKQGHVLVSIHFDTAEQLTKAKKILEHDGAEHISSSAERETAGAKHERH